MSEEALSRALVPVTGEVIPYDAPNETLIEAMYRMRDLEAQLAACRRDVGLEITRRMDADNLRSVEVDGFKVTVAAPGEDWDLALLDEVLEGLIAAGTLTPAATERLFKTERRIQKRELTKLLKNLDGVNSEAADTIRACCDTSRRVRSVKVEDRAGGRGWSA